MKISKILSITVILLVIVLGILAISPLPLWADDLGGKLKDKKISTIENVPMPKLPEPVYILGPAGEIFNFATCNRGELGFTLAAAQIPPGMGPLPHIHHYTNEWFWTPEGKLELFQSLTTYPDLEKPATEEKAGRTNVYTIDMEPNQITYSPKYRVHGFVNKSTEMAPLTFIWIRDESSPKYPFNDGGIREYFDAVGIRFKDLNNLPPITDESKEAFVSDAPKYGINQSYYFLQYVSGVSNKIPVKATKANSTKDTSKTDKELAQIIDAINAYNQGDESVKCF